VEGSEWEVKDILSSERDGESKGRDNDRASYI
jgi:hypothetical protein